MPASDRDQRRLAKRGQANQRQAFVAQRSGDFDQAALDQAMSRLLAAEDAARTAPATARTGTHLGAPAPLAFPSSDNQRWVPIGPSVVRRGQAENRPRVTGRIRDVAVDAAGQRAYAASANGGVWYTGDAGSTWAPVGGWAERARTLGGNLNAQTCGCLLVSFGATPAADVVLVGTGETRPWVGRTGGRRAGLGVLSGIGPAAAAPGASPWERESGLAQLEGLGIYRLARRPGPTPGDVSANPDQVVAATSGGLFIGTRTRVPAVPAIGGNPAVPQHDVYRWVRATGIDALVFGAPPPTPPAPDVTDVAWVANPLSTNDRIVVAAMDSTGGVSSVVAFSDDLGVTFTPVTGLGAATGLQGRASLAEVAGTGRFYVLGDVAGAPPVPTVWQVPTITATPPVATPTPGLPSGADLWSFSAASGTSARDYDQAIAADSVGGTDRVYIGGSTFAPISEWSASLWAYDVGGTVAAPTLGAATALSRTGAPPAGDGADRAGMVGNTVHADVHAIRVTGPAASRQVWVGCDGGVFVSTQAGRVNSFASRAVGLAAIEVGFVANHPTSSHFAAIGSQDNGTQVRVGESVWEATFLGDGGGTVFHPVASQYVVTQYINASWNAQPPGGYADPMLRDRGGPAGTIGREDGTAAFYSGASMTTRTPATARLALGTNRVWVTDDLGVADPCTWRVLPATSGASSDPRPSGGDPVARRAVGVPASGLGSVHTVRWASATDLLALYASGVMHYAQQGDGTWNVTEIMPGVPPTAGAPNATLTTLTDIAPVPGSGDFYLTTTGERTGRAGSTAVARLETCWFYDATARTFTATGLRQALDQTGPPPVTGPNDPAYSVVVDPGTPTIVYVGTVTGVWRGVRTPGTATHAWAPMVNGLPQAAVQDLAVWTDPAGAAGSPTLLRAAIQARGVWEVDLANPEPRRTYVRVHERDDRRRAPTPLANPRRRPGGTPERAWASPDIVVRPRWPMATAPAWRLGGGSIRAGNAPAYQLWTFQTAFRWLYPSIVADGRWSDQLGDLVQLHRTTLGLPAGRRIDRALWDQVVGAVRLGTPSTDTVMVTSAAGDPLAVYRPPWHTPTSTAAPATEVDLLESVVPVRDVADVWRVCREPCTVDVLVHHRDTRPLAADDAWAALLWQSAPTAATLTGADLSGLPSYAASLTTATPLGAPGGWTAVTTAGSAVHRLAVALDARLPRAIPIDIDLSGVPVNDHVALVAIVGSSLDPPTTPPSGAPTSATDVVLAWSHAAMRVVRMIERP